MAYSLENKVIVITGGADGIGRGICEKFLSEGVKVTVIVDFDETRGRETEIALSKQHGEGKIDFIKCDVTTDLETTFNTISKKYRTVDVLVLNAGMGDPTIPAKMVDIHVTSYIEWSLKFLNVMSKNKGGTGGTILMNSSIFGFKTIPFAPVYQATKFAVVGLAKSLGHGYNFDKTGVRVVVICPGFTRTKLNLDLYDFERKKNYADQELVQFIDSNHVWQDVSEVGDAVVTVFKTAKTGSVWAIERGQLTEIVDQYSS